MINRMKRVLILGGSGFIGKNLVEELLADDFYSVIVFDSTDNSSEKEKSRKNFKFYSGNFNAEADLEKVFQENKIDVVVHLISTTIPASSNGANIVYDIESNLVGAIRLLALMKKYNVPKIVFASSGGTIYGLPENDACASGIAECHGNNPICSHGIIKLAIEKYIHLYKYLNNIDYLILRMSNPYGEYHSSETQGLINVILKKVIAKHPVVIWGDGGIVRDYIYVKDCVKAIKRLIDKGTVNEILNIGSGTGRSINDIIEIIREITGDFKIKREAGRKFDVPRVVLDTSKLKLIIDFRPTSIETGIKNTYEWLLKNEPF